MRVCFVVGEIFHWGSYGGFGALTRMIGKNLVKAGIEVYVLLLYKTLEKHRTIETLDGMIVVSPPSRRDLSFYRACDADIYHSEDLSTGTYYAMKANPERKHIVTFQDPMYMEELITSQWSFSPRWNNPFYRMMTKIRWKVAEFFVKRAVHKADALFSQAKYVVPKIVSMYGLKEPPKFLPNPVELPNGSLKKADEPTVCYLARWDPVKRIEIFFKLAKEFPDVKFIALGGAHDKERDACLRKKYGGIPNLEMPGFVSEREKSRVLEKSWILINTSLRECLPVSFLEACAHQCAILSSNNPDNFAGEFGYCVTDRDYAKGLGLLLKDEAWREGGKKGYHYVKENHELSKVIEEHIGVYKSLED